MAKLSPKEAQEKHARNLKASTPDITRGIERVTESPTAKAAAKADKMLANVTKAVQDGKWQAGLNRVTLEEWKSKAINKGVGRIAAGIDEAADKTEKFYADLFPFQDRIADKVGKMPDVTLEDSIQRMVTQCREMAKFKRS